MLSLSNNNQVDVVEAFNYTSRYLDYLLTIDNPHFEQMVSQINPSELHLGDDALISKGSFHANQTYMCLDPNFN